MKGKFDYIVVLGFLTDSRSRLYNILITRLDKAAELYHAGLAKKIVVTGGGRMKGAVGTEAEVMKRYLVSKGIKPGSIATEQKARNTIGNAFYTKLKIDAAGRQPSILVVTSDFHMPRSRLIFRKIFGKGRRIAFAESRVPDRKVFAKAVAYERESLKDTKKYLDGVSFRSSARSVMERLEEYGSRPMPEAMRKRMWY